MNIIENKKRIGIVGRGTAGCLSLNHFYFNNPLNYEIIWYYDDSTLPQSVGEATLLDFPQNLFNYFSFFPHDFEVLDASYKHGIRKINWNGSKDFIHSFPLGSSGLHYNGNKFQDFILNYFKNKISIKQTKVLDPNELDCDYVINCTGKPNEYQTHYTSTSTPVNSAYVVNCYWDKPRFNNSLHIARPYGWVFGIPLSNRISVGYMFNKEINSLEEIKEDIKEVFKDFSLNPSNETQTLSFNNYYKRENFTKKVAYNGTSSYFLEPMESTSLAFTDIINQLYWQHIYQNRSITDINNFYLKEINSIQRVLALHYFAGSIFKTKFWDNAYQKSLKFLDNNLQDPNFLEVYKLSKEIYKKTTPSTFPKYHLNPSRKTPDTISTWGFHSYFQNFEGLGLYNKIDKLLNI